KEVSYLGGTLVVSVTWTLGGSGFIRPPARLGTGLTLTRCTCCRMLLGMRSREGSTFPLLRGLPTIARAGEKCAAMLEVDGSAAKKVDVTAASAEDAAECSKQLAGEVEDTDDVGDGRLRVNK
ncbi:Hypothetical predicted protein, partial [Cloeon dipterum]